MCIRDRGNCFIQFTPGASEEEVRRKELQHYLTHGPTVINYLATLPIPESISCKLCRGANQAFGSQEEFVTHLKSSHDKEVLTLFRDFPSSQLQAVTYPTICCVCKFPDPEPAHLSKHGDVLLKEIGILAGGETEDENSSKFSCQGCGITERTLVKLVRHFIEHHLSLFKFLTGKYHQQHPKPQSSKEPPSVTCRLCNTAIPSSIFNDHLYMKLSLIHI